MINIYVPTYRRKTFPVLNFLKDENITLTLCVRSEEDDYGFYDELKKLDRVNILRLGYSIKDIGETRQAILQHCIDNNIDFCPMFDDSVIRIATLDNAGPAEIIQCCIKTMQLDDYFNCIAGLGFVTRRAYKTETAYREYYLPSMDEYYFADFPSQAIILNVKVLKQHRIQYHAIQYKGLEDCVFVLDCLREGLIFKFNPSYRKDALAANMPKEGGNHVEHDVSTKVRQKYNFCSAKTFNFYKDMMGIYPVGRYRGYLQGEMLLIGFDWSYFRDVLVYDRNNNEHIIKDKLSYSKYLERNIEK